MKRAATMAIGALCALLPGTAWACPVCGTNDGYGASAFAIIGGMIAVPYVVSAIAIRVIRKADAESGPGA